MWTEMSNPAILEELGNRLKNIRLQKNISQKDLGESCGTSEGVIRRLEKGETISIENFIKVLRGLNLLENLEHLIPTPSIGPIMMKKLLKKNKRIRASRKGSDKNKKDDTL